MPLTRYQLRNEYSLAEPELYRAASKDDPEALLEGVAMAGLVGVLRQLGDLAEFAAEIFHDLHEEVIATSERGHGLVARVQQLEADVPSLEKTLLSQTNHAPFFTNPGVDWHLNLQSKQNLVTSGDMPRCVMDSYEECRAPPRLFLLDKFDVAGAGACLKRYSDPSFFKLESALSGVATRDIQREKKIRKGKKKGSRWRNGETPEVVSASRSKLHQLLLEERIESAYSDPERRVKLKRRQLNASPLDPKSGKSFMEKFLETPSPEQKMVYENSVTPASLKLASDHSSESGLQIVDIRTVSPVKRASREEESLSSSPNAEEFAFKPYMEKLNRDVPNTEIVKVPESMVDGCKGEFPRIHHHTVRVNKDGADRFDDLTSDADNYMDALTTMGSDIETDTEFRPKNDLGFSSVGKVATDSDANEEQLEVEAHSSDCRSVGVSFSSDDENNSFNRGRSSYSFSDTVSNQAESALVDTRGNPVLVSSVERGYGEMLSNGGRHDFELSNTDKNETSPHDSPETVLVNPDERLDDTSFTASEKNPVDGLNSRNGNASSSGLLHASNISENASGKEINGDSLDEDIQTGYSEDASLPLDSLPTRSFDEKQVLLHDIPQVKTDSRETEATCSDLDEVSEADETEDIGGKTHEGETVGRGASPLYLDSDIESETATETVLAEGFAVSAADVRASPGSDDVVDQAPSQEDPEIDEVHHEEYDAETVTENERNEEEVALADNDITSRQRESVMQDERNQAEVGRRNSDATPLHPYNYYEAEDVISDFSAAENTENSLNVGDEAVRDVPFELSIQEKESHLEKNTEGVVFSSTCNLSEPGIPLRQSANLQTEPIRENIHLEEADLSSSHPLSRHKESQIDQESCGDASTVHSGEDSRSLPSAIELLPQLETRDLESNKQEMNPIVSTFGQLPEATEINIEEPPPLPPLPPMQWRIGKVQHNSVASPRELAGQGSSPMTPQYSSQYTSQFGLSAFQGGFLQSRSPFSNFAFVEEEKSHHVSEQLAANPVQPTPFSTNLPVMVNHMASQLWGIDLDRNQFLTLPVLQNVRPEYVSFATAGQPIVPPPLVPATEFTTSRVDPVYSYETPAQPQNQSGLDVGSEKELQSYEGDDDSPTYLVVPPSTETRDCVEEDEQPQEIFAEEQKPDNEEEQPERTVAEEQQPGNGEEQPEKTFAEEQQPGNGEEQPEKTVAEEQPQGEIEQTSNEFAPPGLSITERAGSSNTSSPKQPAEVGKENGNASVKNPRPRNPLFDTAAALDKSKLRKVTERVLPQTAPKVEERDSLLEQIRTKSFNLRRAAVTRPNFQGPQTNLKVAAILEKANAIRQACAGSDEDDEDSWSDS